MPNCIFCRIAAGEIPARIVHEDDLVIAFHDLTPVAPTHILLIPKRHIASLAAVGSDDGEVLGRLLSLASRLAADSGLAGGFRVVSNAGDDAGQSVHHLHLHLLGGRAFDWPPG
jgi:histidine triad (HIT) family protein